MKRFASNTRLFLAEVASGEGGGGATHKLHLQSKSSDCTVPYDGLRNRLILSVNMNQRAQPRPVSENYNCPEGKKVDPI